jgi:hypothetical protein
MKVGDLIKAAEGVPASVGLGIIVEHDKCETSFVRVYWFKDEAFEWVQNHYLEVIDENR